MKRQTVSAYLLEWLEAKRAKLRPSTWVRYEEYVRLHAIPHIGHLRLARLGPEHIERLLAARREAGAAPMTVRHLRAVLRTALGQAERWGKVPRNVATLVEPPRAERREMQTLSPEQARAFLDAAKGQRLEALYVLAVTTGMRQGELFALRWRDVNLEAGTVSVTATLQQTREGYVFAEPKTPHSRRQVALGQTGIAALRRHRIAQAEERLRLGPAWKNTDLVFTNEVGDPLDLSNVISRSFHPLLARAGLPRIRFHDLRHTAATLMLGRGVPLKVVSDTLGHSQIAVTADTYMHVTPAMQREAAAALDAVLGS